MRKFILIVFFLSVAAAGAQTAGPALTGYAVGNVVFSNASGPALFDLVLYDILPFSTNSGSPFSLLPFSGIPGTTNLFFQSVTNRGSATVRLSAPTVYNDMGYAGLSVFEDLGARGVFEPILDTAFPSFFDLPAGAVKNLVFLVPIPAQGEGVLSRSAVSFMADNTIWTGAVSPRIAAGLACSLTNSILASPDVRICKASDGVSLISNFDGTGLLRDLDCQVLFCISRSYQASNVELLYSTSAGWSESAARPVSARPARLASEPDAWTATIPAAFTYQTVSFGIRTGNLTHLSGSGSPWKYRVIGLNPAQGPCVVMNNRINPLSGEEVSVSVTLAAAGEIGIKVYSSDGNLVRILAGSRFPAGANLFKWDGRDSEGQACSNGVYLIVVDSTEFKALKKAMVVKK